MRLKVLAAIVNHPLLLFYLRERYPASSYNQGTTFTKDMLNDQPVPKLSSRQMEDLADLVDKITQEKPRGTSAVAESSTEQILNNLIYRFYGDGDAEIEVIERRGR
ncbi:MAG: hypothetical protein JJE04_20715 [Acidobacteriia bacterium]|nr:hypothetical protein [Terriglobia bacterium]